MPEYQFTQSAQFIILYSLYIVYQLTFIHYIRQNFSTKFQTVIFRIFIYFYFSNAGFGPVKYWISRGTWSKFKSCGLLELTLSLCQFQGNDIKRSNSLQTHLRLLFIHRTTCVRLLCLYETKEIIKITPIKLCRFINKNLLCTRYSANILFMFP